MNITYPGLQTHLNDSPSTTQELLATHFTRPSMQGSSFSVREERNIRQKLELSIKHESRNEIVSPVSNDTLLVAANLKIFSRVS